MSERSLSGHPSGETHFGCSYLISVQYLQLMTVGEGQIVDRLSDSLAFNLSCFFTASDYCEVCITADAALTPVIQLVFIYLIPCIGAVLCTLCTAVRAGHRINVEPQTTQ